MEVIILCIRNVPQDMPIYKLRSYIKTISGSEDVIITFPPPHSHRRKPQEHRGYGFIIIEQEFGNILLILSAFNKIILSQDPNVKRVKINISTHEQSMYEYSKKNLHHTLNNFYIIFYLYFFYSVYIYNEYRTF